MVENQQGTVDFRERVKDLVGRWVGYAWFFRRKSQPYPSAEAYYPYEITPFDMTPLDSPVLDGDGKRILWEALDIWLEFGKNLKSDTNFTGIAYARRARYAKLDENDMLPKDENGNFIVEPRLQAEGDLHTEVGLITGFWDVALGETAPVTISKTVSVARGLTLNLDGEFSEDNGVFKMDFFGSEMDGKLNSIHIPHGTGKSLKTTVYTMQYEISDGTVDCGTNCRK